MKIGYIDFSNDGKISIYDFSGKLIDCLDNAYGGVLTGFGDDFFVLETSDSYLSFDCCGQTKGCYNKEFGKFINIKNDTIYFLEPDNHIGGYDRYMQKVDLVQLSLKKTEKLSLKERILRYGENFITFLIILNAIAAGAMTYLDDNSFWEYFLRKFCDVSIVIFIIEMLIRIFYRKRIITFFTDENKGWNIFDLIVTVVSSLSFFSGMESLVGTRSIRILRELRLLRVVSGVKNMKRLFYALVNALPQITWTGIFFLLLYYIYGIIGVELFSSCSENFSSLHRTCLTLMQIMTLDDWTAITLEVMEFHPYAWIYFTSFVIFAAYILANLVVGIVVDSLNDIRDKEELDKSDEMSRELTKLEKQIEILKKLLKNKNN